MSVNPISEERFKQRVGQTWNGRWPLERMLFALAGTLILASAVLAAIVSPWFLLLTGFVGANELLYATLGFCGASLMLTRFFGAQPAGLGGASR